MNSQSSIHPRRTPSVLRAVAVASALFLVACGGSDAATSADPALPAAMRQRDASTNELFTAYSDALVAKDTDALAALLGDEFLLQRTDGSWVDRAGFLERLPDLRAFTATNVEERRGDHIISARLDATADLVVDGVPYKTTPAPILVVFEWADGHWELQAQGNFNLPNS